MLPKTTQLVRVGEWINTQVKMNLQAISSHLFLIIQASFSEFGEVLYLRWPGLCVEEPLQLGFDSHCSGLTWQRQSQDTQKGPGGTSHFIPLNPLGHESQILFIQNVKISAEGHNSLSKWNPKCHMWNIIEVTFHLASFGTPHIPLFNLSSLTGSCIPGNVCYALFPLALVSVKGEHNSFAKKPFPSFVMNNGFITFDLSMSLLPSNLLIITLSRFKAMWSGELQMGFHYTLQSVVSPRRTFSLWTLLQMQKSSCLSGPGSLRANRIIRESL